MGKWPDKVPCEGYLGKNCSNMKSPQANRCRECASEMGRDPFQAAATQRAKEKKLDERLDKDLLQSIGAVAPKGWGSKKMDIITDFEGTALLPIFYSVPPMPGKRAFNERQHTKYNPTPIFVNRDEDIQRDCSDWEFTTWTFSPLTEITRTVGTAKTFTFGGSKKGRKKMGTIRRTDPTKMKESSYRIIKDELERTKSLMAGTEGLSPLEIVEKTSRRASPVFQCFDCGKSTTYKRGISGVLDAFCDKCTRIKERRVELQSYPGFKPCTSKRKVKRIGKKTAAYELAEREARSISQVTPDYINKFHLAGANDPSGAPKGTKLPMGILLDSGEVLDTMETIEENRGKGIETQLTKEMFMIDRYFRSDRSLSPDHTEEIESW